MTLEQTLEFKIWTHQWEAWTRVWEGEPFPLKSCIICLILFLVNIDFTQGLPVGHIVLGQPKEDDCWCYKPKHPETSQSFFSGEFNQGPVRHIRQASLQVAQNTTDIRLASLPRLKRRKYEWWNWWEIDLTLVWRVRVTLYCAQNLSAKMFGHNVGGEMLGGLHQWQNQPDPAHICCSDAFVRNKTFNQFENTNAHQWTPCMEGSIFFAPTTQSTNLYFYQIVLWCEINSNPIDFLFIFAEAILDMIKRTHIEYSSVGKLLQAWPLVACLYSKPKTMNRFSSPRCMLLIQAIQVWDKKIFKLQNI